MRHDASGTKRSLDHDSLQFFLHSFVQENILTKRGDKDTILGYPTVAPGSALLVPLSGIPFGTRSAGGAKPVCQIVCSRLKTSS